MRQVGETRYSHMIDEMNTFVYGARKFKTVVYVTFAELFLITTWLMDKTCNNYFDYLKEVGVRMADKVYD